MSIRSSYSCCRITAQKIEYTPPPFLNAVQRIRNEPHLFGHPAPLWLRAKRVSNHTTAPKNIGKKLFSSLACPKSPCPVQPSESEPRKKNKPRNSRLQCFDIFCFSPTHAEQSTTVVTIRPRERLAEATASYRDMSS